MDAPVAGPSNSSPRQPQPRSSTISSSAISPRRSSRNFRDAPSTPPSTPPPNRRRSRRKYRERDRDKRPLRLYASEDAINKRHSHGLSWSSTTRDSVVDNLLFSLDNLSRPDVTATEDRPDPFYFDRAKYAIPDLPIPFPPTRTARRARAHTHSSSLSTDYDLSAMPESPPRMSVPVKSRRSNSSSKYRPSSTINSRFSISRPSIEGRASVETQKPAVTTTTTNTAADPNGVARESIERGRPDFNFDTLVDRNKNRWKRRSMSVDQIFADSVVSPAISILDRGRPVPSVHSKYDAGYDVAPEPMIAGGPRRKDNPSATGPVYVNQAQQRSTLRKITTQSDLRSANAQGQLSPSVPPEVRNQASNFVRRSGMQSRPTTQGHSTPQPSPALTAPKHPPPLPPTPKDRPGFFRRMFGGSSTRNASNPLPHSHTPENSDPMPSARVSTSTGPQPRTATRQSGEGEPPYHTLTKRPSSLFRRRKKSLSEAPPPPPLPPAFLNMAPPEPSPLGESFQKALDPILKDKTNVGNGQAKEPSRPSTRDSVTEDSDNPDIFHSGYTHRPDASLGSRDIPNWQASQKTTQTSGEDEGLMSKLKIKKRKPDTLAPVNTSFLLDSSSKEASETPSGTPDRIASLTPDHVSKENGLPSPASKASIGNTTFVSSKRSVETSLDGRKPSVVSTIASDKVDTLRTRPSSQGSRKSDRMVLHPSVEELLFSDQSVLPVLPISIPRSDSISSPGFRSATSGTFPAEVHSPLSPQSQYHSATSLPLPSVQRDGEEVRISSELVGDGAEYRERAQKIFDGDEEDVAKSEAAAWLGEGNTLSKRTLSAYLQLFDFAGVNILTALRLLCGRLTLRGETQQFDRIITALSSRWCECNPNHGFKAQDVIHTICYSLILLNTDLHLADIEGKMSRSAYVKNTLPTIRRVVTDAAPNAFDDTIRPSPLPSRSTLPWTFSNGSISPSFGTPTMAERPSIDQERSGLQKSLSVRPNIARQDSDYAEAGTGPGAASNALVNQVWTGSMRAWESEIESILKSFFVAIKIEPLPLHGAPAGAVTADRNLSAASLGGIRRTNSVISKSPSDTTSFRSKPGGLRSVTNGFQNKHNLGRSKLYPSSTLSSSKTSFDDGGSVFSPAQSTWSKYSFSKTLTSASMQSLGQHFTPTADFKHSIGFANALSQAIIREENAGVDNESVSMSVAGGLLDDEALTLEGAPWAKEGLVKHKHHLETPGKKARERNWTDCFAVISKGKLTLFAFNTSSKSASMGRKTVTKAQAGGRTVGGGDWMGNAEQLDVFVLRQTIASTLPPPGYSKTRPHVWALSLPTGAVHLFQVGTADIAQEFMSTANYWSARLSKEPLSGGVSNIEYGWSDQVINLGLVSARPYSPPVPVPPVSIQSRQAGHKHSTSVASLSKQSMTSTLRTSLDTGFGAKPPRLPADKVHLADWQPPTQSMMASALMEVDQLKALTAYVSYVATELAKHNELKAAIDLAFSPRHANYARAMANWQRKSDYLLRENVKFQTYVDSLTKAQEAREQFYARKNALEEDSSKEKRDEPAAAVPKAVAVGILTS